MKLDEGVIARCLTLEAIEGLVSDEAKEYLEDGYLYENDEKVVDRGTLRLAITSDEEYLQKELLIEEDPDEDEVEETRRNIQLSKEILGLMEINNIHYIIRT